MQPPRHLVRPPGSPATLRVERDRSAALAVGRQVVGVVLTGAFARWAEMRPVRFPGRGILAEEDVVPGPERLQIDTRIARRDRAPGVGVENPGASRFTGPSATALGGRRGPPLARPDGPRRCGRRRLEELIESVEDALRDSVRSLEESRLLMPQMAARVRDAALSSAYEREAAEVRAAGGPGEAGGDGGSSRDGCRWRIRLSARPEVRAIARYWVIWSWM